jgi:hypothetical protein
VEEVSTELVSTEVLPAGDGAAVVWLGVVAALAGGPLAGVAEVGDGVHQPWRLAWALASRARRPGTQVGDGIRVGVGIKVGAVPAPVLLPGTAAARSGSESGPVGDGVPYK